MSAQADYPSPRTPAGRAVVCFTYSVKVHCVNCPARLPSLSVLLLFKSNEENLLGALIADRDAALETGPKRSSDRAVPMLRDPSLRHSLAEQRRRNPSSHDQ
jgi:hypothetical protein